MFLIDEYIITFLNQFANCSIFVDNFIFLLANNKLFKGGIMIAIIWGLWFTDEKDQLKVRKNILISLSVCLIAIIMGKLLALLLPFRYRPIHDPNLAFKLPYGVSNMNETVNGVLLNSMPSDHAVLYFTLATGLFFVNKKVGILTLLYTIIIISLPRIYIGFHYPSDILVGAVIGISMAIIGNKFLIKNEFFNRILKFVENRPKIFYAIFFLISYQIADLFTDSYQLVKSGINSFLTVIR